MKKLLYLFTALTLLFSACSKEKTGVDPTENENAKRLRQIAYLETTKGVLYQHATTLK